MRVLIAWGSQRGGTEGIARALGEVLTNQGCEVTLSPAQSARILRNHYDAAIIGGALYGKRWQRDARRLVVHGVDELRRMPVWFFSSGPLDDSADRVDIPPTAQVAALMKRVGAQGHRTFGGRLTPDAKGFLASAIAKRISGDFRNLERVRAWALELAQALPNAKPAGGIEQPARSTWRTAAHGLVAWAICASLRALVQLATDPQTALQIELLIVPLVYVAVARHHFRSRGAPDALATAIVFTVLFALLDGVLIVTRVAEAFALPEPRAIAWPIALPFLATWITGSMMSLASARKELAERH